MPEEISALRNAAFCHPDEGGICLRRNDDQLME